jgi:hypothetical protein
MRKYGVDICQAITHTLSRGSLANRVFQFMSLSVPYIKYHASAVMGHTGCNRGTEKNRTTVHCQDASEQHGEERMNNEAGLQTDHQSHTPLGLGMAFAGCNVKNSSEQSFPAKPPASNTPGHVSTSSQDKSSTWMEVPELRSYQAYGTRIPPPS